MKQLRFFSEIPGFFDLNDKTNRIDSIAILSEKYNFTGALIYYFLGSLDPWLMASRVIHSTDRLIPLIATQPYSLPPFGVAKIVRSFAAMYERKVSLNLITGVLENELISVNETIDPKVKYSRLQEYIQVLRLLTTSIEPVNFTGSFYQYQNLRLSPPLDKKFTPEIFIPGSSVESIKVAEECADTTLLRPEPINLFKSNYLSRRNSTKPIETAVRFSVIARNTSNEAWSIAEKRFPYNRVGILKTRQSKKTLSHNTRLMAELAIEGQIYDDVYWMGAYLNGSRVDPFLVGSYSDVADYLRLYVEAGVTTFLFGDLHEEEYFEHIAEVIKLLRGDIWVAERNV